MRLSKDEEKPSISSFAPRVDRDRLLRCLLPQDMGYAVCHSKYQCMSGSLGLVFRR